MDDGPRENEPPGEDELAELAALADGSLDPKRRAALELRVAESPELQRLLAEQRTAIKALRLPRDEAPAALRARISERRRRPARWVRRVRFAAAAVLAAAALAVVLVLVLPGERAGAPTVAEAARLSARAPTGPAPPAEARPALLDRKAEDLPFPNFRKKFGWRAMGVRVDRVKGRRVTTVFYAKRGLRIGYAIVSGAPLPGSPDAAITRRGRTRLQSFEDHGRLVVTWLRKGHTCALSGIRVERNVLLDLAAWSANGAIPF